MKRDKEKTKTKIHNIEVNSIQNITDLLKANVYRKKTQSQCHSQMHDTLSYMCCVSCPHYPAKCELYGDLLMFRFLIKLAVLVAF